VEEYINYRGVFLKKGKSSNKNSSDSSGKFFFYRFNAGSFQDAPIIFHDNINYDSYEDSWLIELIEKNYLR